LQFILKPTAQYDLKTKTICATECHLQNEL